MCIIKIVVVIPFHTQRTLLDFYPFASAWNRWNKLKIDAITRYCNSMRLVGRRSKLSSSNIFLVWLQMFGYCKIFPAVCPGLFWLLMRSPSCVCALSPIFVFLESAAADLTCTGTMFVSFSY
jgi:hypothetical protein